MSQFSTRWRVRKRGEPCRRNATETRLTRTSPPLVSGQPLSSAVTVRSTNRSDFVIWKHLFPVSLLGIFCNWTLPKTPCRFLFVAPAERHDRVRSKNFFLPAVWRPPLSRYDPRHRGRLGQLAGGQLLLVLRRRDGALLQRRVGYVQKSDQPAVSVDWSELWH